MSQLQYYHNKGFVSFVNYKKVGFLSIPTNVNLLPRFVFII